MQQKVDGGTIYPDKEFNMLNVSNIDDLTALVDLIANKIDSDDNSEECENVKNLSSFEKTVYCAFNYHLEQMNDGFVAVFTGYMSPLLYEIREALNQIGAEVNLELLNEAIKKVNVEGKSEEDFLIDVENEELDHLYDEDTEDEYYDFLNNLDKKLYDCDKEDINELLIEYIKKAKE